MVLGSGNSSILSVRFAAILNVKSELMTSKKMLKRAYKPLTKLLEKFNGMRSLIVAALMLISCVTYAGVSAVMLHDAIEKVFLTPGTVEAVSPEEALNSVDSLDVGMGSAKEMSLFIGVGAGQSVYTDFGEYQSLAFPVIFQQDLPATDVLINSYMVKPKKGRKFILYPLVTAFNSEKSMLGTLLPSNESDIKGNTIKNIFAVPEGTRYLLLHTDPRLATYDMKNREQRDSDAVYAGIAGLGGAIGGLINGVLFNSKVARGKVDIAEVGIVEVMEVTPE